MKKTIGLVNTYGLVSLDQHEEELFKNIERTISATNINQKFHIECGIPKSNTELILKLITDSRLICEVESVEDLVYFTIKQKSMINYF